jgi:hypothetical protein
VIGRLDSIPTKEEIVIESETTTRSNPFIIHHGAFGDCIQTIIDRIKDGEMTGNGTPTIVIFAKRSDILERKVPFNGFGWLNDHTLFNPIIFNTEYNSKPINTRWGEIN